MYESLFADLDNDSPFLSIVDDEGNKMVVWIASDSTKIPDDVCFVDPRSQQPLRNADGSLFRYSGSLDAIKSLVTPRRHPGQVSGASDGSAGKMSSDGEQISTSSKADVSSVLLSVNV